MVELEKVEINEEGRFRERLLRVAQAKQREYDVSMLSLGSFLQKSYPSLLGMFMWFSNSTFSVQMEFCSYLQIKLGLFSRDWGFIIKSKNGVFSLRN